MVKWRELSKLWEDILWAYVIDYGGSWYDHLSLIEFIYYNSYHSIIGMAPFKHCMVEGVDLLLGGTKFTRVSYLGPI